MIGFLIKKTFFDLWDNMFRIVLLNLGFIASLAIPIFLPRFESFAPFSFFLFALGILWCFIYLAAASICVKEISDYGSFGFHDFAAGLKKGWKVGVVFGITCFLLIFFTQVTIPFYLAMENSLAGIAFAAIIFWTLLLSMVSFQFFLPIYARLDKRITKVFKKCFIIFFDNPAFSIFTLLHCIVTLALSLLLALLFPGPIGILLFLDQSLRLRLLKYDWLEANPDIDAKQKRNSEIPWDAILIEEREKTGTRTIRNFIFPWKD